MKRNIEQFGRGIAEIELEGFPTVNLPYAKLGQAAVSQRQSFSDRADHDDLGGTISQDYGSSCEGAEYIYDGYSAPCPMGARKKALKQNFHLCTPALSSRSGRFQGLLPTLGRQDARVSSSTRNLLIRIFGAAMSWLDNLASALVFRRRHRLFTDEEDAMRQKVGRRQGPRGGPNGSALTREWPKVRRD